MYIFRFLLFISLISGGAQSAADENAVVIAIQNKAQNVAKQSLSIHLKLLNIDQNWAIALGTATTPNGEDLDWDNLEQCDSNLDKLLWAVLNKADNQWRIEQFNLCASEPPHWYLEAEIGLIWPCGVYRNLQITAEETLEHRCRALR